MYIYIYIYNILNIICNIIFSEYYFYYIIRFAIFRSLCLPNPRSILRMDRCVTNLFMSSFVTPEKVVSSIVAQSLLIKVMFLQLT